MIKTTEEISDIEDRNTVKGFKSRFFKKVKIDTLQRD